VCRLAHSCALTLTVFGKIWSDSSNAELVQLPSGSLYLVRPGSIKGSRECIYKDAVATIRRTTTPYNYQLVITRAYEEGEEQLLEESEEADDERSFLIDERLQFRASTTAADTASPSASGSSSPTSAAAAATGKAKQAVDEVPTFVWRADLSSDGGDEDDLLELVVNPGQVNSVTRSVFEVTFLQCVFERKYGKDHEEATDEDLEKLKYKCVKGISSPRRTILTSQSLADHLAHIPIYPQSLATCPSRGRKQLRRNLSQK